MKEREREFFYSFLLTSFIEIPPFYRANAYIFPDQTKSTSIGFIIFSFRSPRPIKPKGNQNTWTSTKNGHAGFLEMVLVWKELEFYREHHLKKHHADISRLICSFILSQLKIIQFVLTADSIGSSQADTILASMLHVGLGPKNAATPLFHCSVKARIDSLSVCPVFVQTYFIL